MRMSVYKNISLFMFHEFCDGTINYNKSITIFLIYVVNNNTKVAVLLRYCFAFCARSY